MSDPTREQKPAAKPKAAPKDKASAKQPASKTPAGMEPSKQWNLTTQHTIDLGDAEVGRMTEVRTSLFAVNSEHGPRVQARVTGEPSIELVRAPMYLPGSLVQYDPEREFVFRFAPKREGRLAGTLELQVLDPPLEWHRMRIVGAAHYTWAPTLDEQERQAKEARQREQERLGAERELQQQRKEIDQDQQLNYDVHSGLWQQFEDQRHHAAAAIRAVYQARRDGVKAAWEEVQGYKRLPPRDESSLWFDLAMLALSTVGAGIAAAIAQRLRPAFKMVLGRTVPPRRGRVRDEFQYVDASEPALAFVTDSLKHVIKSGVNRVAPTKHATSEVPSSHDMVVSFFQAQLRGLAGQDGRHAEVETLHLKNLLRPRFRSERGVNKPPDGAAGAIAAMVKIKEEADAECANAEAQQMDASVRNWVRYLDDRVSRTTTGTRHSRLDGVIDVEFKASQVVPTDPIRITGARLVGVKRAVVARLMGRPLQELDVGVRAIGYVTPEYTVIAYRSGAGEILVRDESNGDPERGSWFARRAGVNARPRLVDQERGAKLLLDKEILSKSLGELLPDRVGVENDSAD